MADTAVKIPFAEAAAPSTPAASKVVIYAKSDGLMYSKDDAGVETLMSGGAGGGSVATDAIWDAAGDLAVGTGANTAARLAIGATNGMVVQRVSGSVAWALPSGHVFDHTEFTSDVAISATTSAGANTIVTASAVTFDGSTAVVIEYFAEFQTGSGGNLYAVLYDGSTELGWMGVVTSPSGVVRVPVSAPRRLTPSAASHTYSVRGFRDTADGTMKAGSGASGTYPPGFIRITKA